MDTQYNRHSGQFDALHQLDANELATRHQTRHIVSDAHQFSWPLFWLWSWHPAPNALLSTIDNALITNHTPFKHVLDGQQSHLLTGPSAFAPLTVSSFVQPRVPTYDVLEPWFCQLTPSLIELLPKQAYLCHMWRPSIR